MSEYWDIFVNGYTGYARYFWREITNPSLHNYFYWLVGISIFFMLLEWFAPWRQNQRKFRQDFWLDAFYMFFNFFLFSLIIYNAASDVIVNLFNEVFQSIFGFDIQSNNPLQYLPTWGILLIGLVVRDFVQWWTHRLLHRIDFLWEFHKVHHSVQQMGFAAHLRYHWMETITYRTIEYIPLALLGIGLYDFFLIHIFTLAVGHYNHSNITVSGHRIAAIIGALIGVPFAIGAFELPHLSLLWNMNIWLIVIGFSFLTSMILGPFIKYIFNSPEMHIWHHSKKLPNKLRYGMNFGITLSIWDWIWGTAHIPYQGRDIELGFPGMQEFPNDFVHQTLHGIVKDS